MVKTNTHNYVQWVKSMNYLRFVKNIKLNFIRVVISRFKLIFKVKL